MTAPEATFIAALVAAGAALIGVVWSVVAFFLTRRSLRQSTAREEWRARFEQAHTLALSADARESRTGILMIEKLGNEKWVTDEDKASAASVLNSLRGGNDNETDEVATRAREDLLGKMNDRSAAANLAKVPRGIGGRFELWRDRSGQFRFNLKASNGQIVMTSGPYATKQESLKAINLIRRTGGDGDGPAVTLVS